MEYYLGEGIANQFTQWGCPCEFLTLEFAPQLISYHFKLLNVLTLQRAKKLLVNLSALCGCHAEYLESKVGNFSLTLETNERQLVRLTEFGGVLESAKPFSVALGVDCAGNKLTATLDEMTHILCGGQSGSGKSVFLNSFIMSLACYNRPEDVGLILCDIKQVEFAKFSKLPHLLCPVVTEVCEMKRTLDWLVGEMERRYSEMRKMGISKVTNEFKRIVLVVDELADAMLQSAIDLKTPLVRLSQKARACGITLCLCTQAIRVKVCDGLLLANLPTRIILTCSHSRESVLALGHGGAEKLIGKGDCLVKLPNKTQDIRVQVPFINDDEIEKLMG